METKHYELRQQPKGDYILFQTNRDPNRGILPPGDPGEGEAYWDRIVSAPPPAGVILNHTLYIRDDTGRFKKWLTRGRDSHITGDYLRRVAVIPAKYRAQLPDHGWPAKQLSF